MQSSRKIQIYDCLSQAIKLSVVYLMVFSGGVREITAAESQNSSAPFDFSIIRGANLDVWNIKAADINNNGQFDVISVGLSKKELKIHYGNGDGTFAAPVGIGFDADNFTLGNANQDDLIDIISVQGIHFQS